MKELFLLSNADRVRKESSLSFIDADVEELRVAKVGEEEDDVDELTRHGEQLGGEIKIESGVGVAGDVAAVEAWDDGGWQACKSMYRKSEGCYVRNKSNYTSLK